MWEALESFKLRIEENCPPTLILTLTLNQALTLTGGNFPRGQLSGHRLKLSNQDCVYGNFIDKQVLY